MLTVEQKRMILDYIIADTEELPEDMEFTKAHRRGEISLSDFHAYVDEFKQREINYLNGLK